MGRREEEREGEEEMTGRKGRKESRGREGGWLIQLTVLDGSGGSGTNHKWVLVKVINH